MNKQSLQAVPHTVRWRSVPWISKAELLNGIVHLSEVAGSTRHDSIVKTIITPASVREHMVVLSPERLNCGILISVGTPSRKR